MYIKRGFPKAGWRQGGEERAAFLPVRLGAAAKRAGISAALPEQCNYLICRCKRNLL